MLNRDAPRSAKGPPEQLEPVVEALAHALPGQAEHPPPPRPLHRWIMRILPLALLAAAGFVLWREFHHLSWTAVAQAMEGWGHKAILEALALSVASFLLMGVIEWMGLRWAGAKVPWGAAVTVSFLANAIAHSTGANLLVSGAVRAKVYDRYGVTLTQVAATTLFGGVSFGVGLAALGGVGMLLAGADELTAINLPVTLARVAGAVLVGGAVAYIILCAVRRAPISIFRRSFELPSGFDAAAQMVVGIVDNGIAAAIVWILLPPGSVSYLTFVGAYAVAAVAGLISTVPGGAGVFEGTLSTLLSNVDAAHLAAAFLGYRLAYYVLPLVIAALALAGDTLRQARKPAAQRSS